MYFFIFFLSQTEVASPASSTSPSASTLEGERARAAYEYTRADVSRFHDDERCGMRGRYEEGRVVELCMDRRGTQLEHTFLDESRVMMRYRIPLGEVAADFSDELKSRTSGYATFDYDDAGWERADIVRLDVLVNGLAVDALASLVHRDKAVRRGREFCAKLRDVLPRQLFEVSRGA